jgi:hypothetical protein
MDKAKKGCGLHWDIVLLCLLNSIAGLLGGPWICVATVRAMSHLSALTVMSTTHAPGETPKVIEIKGNPSENILGHKTPNVIRRILKQLKYSAFPA